MLQGAGLVSRAPRRGAHRRRRAAQALRRHDAAARRLAPRVAGRPGAAASDRHPGRRHRRDLLGLPGRGGGHGLDLPGAQGGVRRARPARRALYRPRAATTSMRPRQAARSTRAGIPRSGSLCTSSASSTSPPTRRKPAAARSVPSAPCRTAWSRSWRWPASPRSRPPTASSKSATCPSTTAASPSRPSSRTQPSCPSSGPARSTTSSVSRQSAASQTTTPCDTATGSCKSPPDPADPTTSKRASACTSTPTVRSPFFHGPRCLARYHADASPSKLPTRQAA